MNKNHAPPDDAKRSPSPFPGCAAQSYSQGDPITTLTLKDALAAYVTPHWLDQLKACAGAKNVSCSPTDLWAYARDRAPFATFQIRNGNLPATLPSAVVSPGSVEEVAAIVRFARENHIALIPFGAGSGVMGGTLPLTHELMIDLKRLNRLLDLNKVDHVATVQAGMNGGQFEAALNEQGFTCGHFPQSLHMSTVGGWAACRGAGQNSSRYGKIEDMILGLEVILPDGRPMRIRPIARRAVGPGIKDLFVGSEGTLGILTELNLRVWPLPQARHGAVIAFPTVQAGLDAMRTIMQSELRPAVVRLYNEHESVSRTKGHALFNTHPVLAIMEFSGLPRLAELERDMSVEICAAHGGRPGDEAIYHEWQAHRFLALSAPWQARDYFVDTIEVTGNWSALPAMYADMSNAIRSISPDIDFGAHWSHVYPEGACQYMTIRISPMPEAEGLRLMRRAWQMAQEICLQHGGAISHHHGVGLMRNAWMAGEHAIGMEIFAGLKKVLDPEMLFTPGKLGMHPDQIFSGSQLAKDPS